MERDEFLRPHELAERIKDTGYEIRNNRVESVQLSGLIDRSQTVWRELAKGTFEENEYGYATIGVEDWVGDYTTSSGDHVDMLVVYFNDPNGTTLRLGNVSRLSSWGAKATANVARSESDTLEPLLPTDERWDAVVGVVERAVAHCQHQKAMSQQQRRRK